MFRNHLSSVRFAGVLVLLLALGSPLFAQPVAGERLSHNLDSAAIDTAIQCTGVPPIPEEGWLRLYTPRDFGITGDFEVVSVSFAVQCFAGGTVTTQEVDVILYESAVDSDPLFADLEELQRETFLVGDSDNLTVFTYELEEPLLLDADTTFGVEIRKPDFGTLDDRIFLVSGNGLGEVGASYYVPPPDGCGGLFDEPVDLNALLLDPIHNIIDVGFVGGCVPPRRLTCESVAGDALLTWENIGGYTEIEVFRDGVSIAVLEGDAVSYTDEDVAANRIYSLVARTIEGAVDCSIETAPCRGGAFEACSEPDALLSDAVGAIEEIIDFDSDFEIGDLDVSILATHAAIEQVEFMLSNEAGTSVTLKVTEDGPGFGDMDVRFDDAGYDYRGSLINLGLTLLPVGPGSLEDFEGAEAFGEWTLTAEDTVAGENGTLDEWCLYVRAVGTDEFIRGDVDGNGTVSPLLDGLAVLQWQFAGGVVPPCMDAADVDGNNVAAALLDSLYLLQWGFLQGDEPPAPGLNCGPDDDLDADLDCETPPVACS